nr:MAG TPA: hypothetical protein [Caudoviricetes sp.]
MIYLNGVPLRIRGEHLFERCSPSFKIIKKGGCPLFFIT